MIIAVPPNGQLISFGGTGWKGEELDPTSHYLDGKACESTPITVFVIIVSNVVNNERMCVKKTYEYYYFDVLVLLLLLVLL